MKSLTLCFFILVLPSFLLAQVNQIKAASGQHSNAMFSSGDGYSSGSGFFADFFFNIMLSGIIRAQADKLEQRHQIPTLVSLDIMAQAATQPSTYYIVTPRIRANWGLLSTDFRFNYLIEEDIEGVKHIRTNDWQILQLNLITTRNVVARVGGGILQEAFNDRQAFLEWTAGFNYQVNASRVGGMAEFRSAEPRKEFSAFAQYRLFDQRAMHGFVTGGLMYQRYYGTITAWGLQGGFIFRIY